MFKKTKLLWLGTIITIFLVICLSLSLGTISLSLKEIVRGLFIHDQSLENLIIWETRLPRIIVGGLVGSSLALAGVILQSLLHNNLASPSTIGVTSGASFMGYLLLVVFPTCSFLLPFSTILGSLIITLLIYFLGYKNGALPNQLILAGVAIATLFGAFNDIIRTYYSDSIGNATGFLVGGLNGITWSSLSLILPFFVIAILLICFLPKQLDILLLGDDMAKGLGVNVSLIRLILILIAAILAGSAVAVGGLIGFVGLIVPHIARILFGSKHSKLLLASSLLGFILVVLCDTLGRIILKDSEIPVSIILAILGAPFFIFLLRSKNR